MGACYINRAGLKPIASNRPRAKGKNVRKFTLSIEAACIVQAQNIFKRGAYCQHKSETRDFERPQ